MTDDYMKLLDWATGDDTGVSSNAILRFMVGLPPNKTWGCAPPADAADRGRCIRLLNIFPEFWDRLDDMAKINKYWAEQIKLIKKDASSK